MAKDGGMANGPKKLAEIGGLPPHHVSLSRVLRESVQSERGGEVVARYGSESGRIYVAGGRVAWVVCSTVAKTFRRHLLDKSLVDDQDLKEVFAESKRQERNFAEFIVDWQLMDAKALKEELREHISMHLLELLSWPGLETMFVPSKQVVNARYAFTLQEVFQTAAELNRQTKKGLVRTCENMVRQLEQPLGKENPSSQFQESPGAHKANKPGPRLEGQKSATQRAAVQLGKVANLNAERSRTMDVGKLKEMFEEFKNNSGDGLLASDIFTRSDAQSIIGYNSNSAACALFNRVSMYLEESLKGSKFPPIDRYLYLDLVDNKSVVLVNLGPEYLWGMLFDRSKIQVGMLLNVILPKAIEKFVLAVGSGGPRVAAVGKSAPQVLR